VVEAAPVTIADPLDASLLARYAVLRRPATAVDLPPPINTLAEQIDFSLGRYNPAYIRQLAQRPGGRRFFLVPGLPRCDREPIACIVQLLPTRTTDASDAPGSCPRFRDVTHYAYLASGVFDGNEQAGILPDGIASLRVHFKHAATLQVPVVANFYLYKADRARRRKFVRTVGRILVRLYGPHRVRNKARRRKLERKFARAVVRYIPTNIELLATDGHVIQNVKRSKNATLGFILP
jgi:hypothetical protein